MEPFGEHDAECCGCGKLFSEYEGNLFVIYRRKAGGDWEVAGTNVGEGAVAPIREDLTEQGYETKIEPRLECPDCGESMPSRTDCECPNCGHVFYAEDSDITCPFCHSGYVIGRDPNPDHGDEKWICHDCGESFCGPSEETGSGSSVRA